MPKTITTTKATRGRPTIPEQNVAPLDLIVGIEAIARALGTTRRKASYWHETGLLPTFKLKGTVCARRSELDAALRASRRSGEGE
jgi:hypothetical protein